VNAVAPGNIDTPMNQELYDKFGGREAFRVQYPMGRIGLEEDVASAVTYLVSDEAEWITGVVMPVDGGYMAK
jgi:NAD(P)-dependent dehydrogenase (short-subunit alcohol dehydrogenase family)